MSDIYDKTVVLTKDLTNVECWNWTVADRVTLPAGTEIVTLHVNDATRTVIRLTDRNGLDFQLAGGKKRTGYRFIVNNTQLREATGIPVPDRTGDLVGDLIRFESGEMNDQETREFLSALRQAGLLDQLQGVYGRTAAALGV